MLLVLRISRPGKRRGNCVFQEKHISEKEKTSGKNHRNRVLNLKLEALEVVELMELMDPVRSREAALRETCVIVHRMQKKVKDIHVSVVQS